MASLRELLGTGEKRSRLIDDALHVLDAEVDDKGGLSGIAIKTAYKLVKGVSPSFLRQVVDHLMDDFLNSLDPLYQEAVSTNVPPRKLLEQNPGRRRRRAALDHRQARAERQKADGEGHYEEAARRRQEARRVGGYAAAGPGLFEKHASA